jgi:hypothetical protein
VAGRAPRTGRAGAPQEAQPAVSPSPGMREHHHDDKLRWTKGSRILTTGYHILPCML